MNIYSSLDSAWSDTVELIESSGDEFESRVGLCKEVFGHSFKLSNTDNVWLSHEARKLDPCYAAAETLWYLAGTNSIELIQAYAPQYKKFSEDGIAFGAYGPRIADRDPSFIDVQRRYSDPTYEQFTAFDAKHHLGRLEGKPCMTQIASVIALLREQPMTRQAVITMWNAGDLLHSLAQAHKDVPCTLALQFKMSSENKLHCNAFMRSNDVWLGLPYDVFAFTTIQRLIANAVGVEPGTYTHSVGSMHLYDRNAQAAREALVSGPSAYNGPIGWPGNQPGKLISLAITRALVLEKHARRIAMKSDKKQAKPIDINIETSEESSLNVVCADLVELCMSKWTGLQPATRSQVLRNAWSARYKAED